MKSETGKTSSLGQYLSYKFTKETALSLADHDYCKKPLFDYDIISNDDNKLQEIKYYIHKQSCDYEPSTSSEQNMETFISQIVAQNNLPISLEKQFTVYNTNNLPHKKIHESLNNQIRTGNLIVTIDLSSLDAPRPCGTNYVDIDQNTEEWHKHRQYKVTGSRLPALLGIYGKAKYDTMWSVVKKGDKENYLGNIKNIERGHMYEDEAISNFKKISKAGIERCGFFIHPSDTCYGSSPDGLGPAAILLEVKTRAANSDDPLMSIEKVPQYFVQCQLQMQCTEAEFTILQSYHPETQSSNFFLIKRDNTLMTVKDVIDSILHDQPIMEWNHNEIFKVKGIG